MKRIIAVLLAAMMIAAILPIPQVEAASKSAKAYLADGNKFLSQSKYIDAIKAFDAAIKLNSKYTEAYVGKGRAQYGIKTYAAALASLDKAISLNKKYAAAYYYKGLTLLELDKLPECISAYNSAIALNPKYAEAYNDKGFALEQTEKYDDALKCYDTAIKLNSKLSAAYVNKAALLLTHYKKHTDANKVIDAALKLSPSNSSALYYKAEILQALNKHIEAIAYYDKAIKLDSKAPTYYYSKGYSQYMSKKYADAVISFSKAIELYPKELPANSKFFYYRGLAYRESGKFDLAIQDINKAAAIDPLYANTFNGVIDKSKYNNDYLGLEIAIPTEWSISGINIIELIKKLGNFGEVQIPDTYLPVLATKYPLASSAKSNPIFMLSLQSTVEYPEIKTGKDYLPYLLNMIAKQREYKSAEGLETIIIDSLNFDVLNGSTEENGIVLNQKIYATIYRGYAICFVLSYTDKAELPELENILTTVKFKK